MLSNTFVMDDNPQIILGCMLGNFLQSILLDHFAIENADTIKEIIIERERESEREERMSSEGRVFLFLLIIITQHAFLSTSVYISTLIYYYIPQARGSLSNPSK